MRFQIPRESYIPKGSTKIVDKLSDAVAYLSDHNDRPTAMYFQGKIAKPVSHIRYSTKEKREQAIVRFFEARRNQLADKTAAREKRKAWVCPFKVGDIFRTHWGYDQTNIEYFEIVELKGKHAILRELKQKRVETAWAQGNCVPLPGEYIGEPLRRLCQECGFKISGNYRWASGPVGEIKAGIRVIEPSHWTAYA